MRRFDLVDDVHEGARMVEHPEGDFVLYSEIDTDAQKMVKQSELRFVSIQCVPVSNTAETQCNVFMYGLDKVGQVWHKRDVDQEWSIVSMSIEQIDLGGVLGFLESGER